MKELYIITNNSKAGQYGIGTYITQLLYCLQTCIKIQVTVIMLDSQKDELVEKHIESVRYLLLPTIQIHALEKDYRRYARSVAYVLASYIAPNRELIFHFNYSYHIWLAEALKNRFPRCRTILTLHYLPWCFDLSGNIHRFRAILSQEEKERDILERQIYEEYLNDKRFYNEVDKVICLCGETQSFLYEIYNVPIEKIELIYNGLSDEQTALSNKDKKEIKAELGFTESEKIILFVGRVNQLKGIHWLIEAFKKTLSKYPEARLIIIGDGNISDYLGLCNGIWGKVIFTGKLRKDQLYRFYQIADIGVLPSCQEQCSYVGIEMLMHGIPLVGTDAMGISEMIEEGYKIPLKIGGEEISLCTDKLSDSILSALANKGFFGKRARHRFEKYYSLNTMRLKVTQLYNSE